MLMHFPRRRHMIWTETPSFLSLLVAEETK